MDRRRLRLLFIAVMTTSLVLSACNNNGTTGVSQRGKEPVEAQTKTKGDAQVILGSKIESWEILQPDGSIHLVGVTLPIGAVQTAATGGNNFASITLNLPAETKKQAAIDHVEIRYEPGSSEAVFGAGVPFFSFRFYSVDQDAEKAIDCTDSQPVPIEKLPDGFPQPGEPTAKCVPSVGIIAVDNDTSGSMDQAPYGKVALAYYKGQLTMIEPKVTLQNLLKKQTFTLNIPTPKTLGSGSLLFPTMITGVYNNQSNLYDLSLYGFTDLSGPNSSN